MSNPSTLYYRIAIVQCSCQDSLDKAFIVRSCSDGVQQTSRGSLHQWVPPVARMDMRATQDPSPSARLILPCFLKQALCSDALECALQMERAFTPPLLARMGDGAAPDPNNITRPVMTSFNDASWQSASKALSAHHMGGLRFSSFR